jgi:hypothetical protein
VGAAVAVVACSAGYRSPSLAPDALAELTFTRGSSEHPWLTTDSALTVQIYDYGVECPGWLGFESSLSLAYRDDLVSLWSGDARTASVPAGGWIFLRTHRGGVMLLGATVTCELRVGWVPEAGHRYDVAYANTTEACHVRVSDRETGQPIRVYAPRDCRPLR